MRMILAWLRVWWLAFRPRLAHFFLFPWAALACLFLGHRPLLLNGEYVCWKWHPQGGDLGPVQPDGTRSAPGVKFFACFRCRNVFAVPGPLLVEPRPGSRRVRREDDRAARRLARKAGANHE